MRSYLILKEKVARFHADAEIQGVISALRQQDSAYSGPAGNTGYSRTGAEALKTHSFDVEALAQRGRRYEELDQLVMELLLGVR
jgi:xylose isomerase